MAMDRSSRPMHRGRKKVCSFCVDRVEHKHFEIQNKMQSHHKFNEHKTVEQIAARIKGGENIALVSDAGTPAISDPGFMLVRECVRQGVDVECLPGATAFVPALVASGLPNEKFCFEGFLPQKKEGRPG